MAEIIRRLPDGDYDYDGEEEEEEEEIDDYEETLRNLLI